MGKAAAFLILLLAVAPTGGGAETKPPLRLLAASSLTDVLQSVRGKNKGGPSFELVLASSSTLARQIANGAPADLFLSAHPRWIEYLRQRDMVAPDGVREIAGNRLVLAAHIDNEIAFSFANGSLLLPALQGRRLVVGDPAHVPAGVYAEQALTTLGQWAQLKGRMAHALSVRSAVRLMRRNRNPGIVYASDVRSAPDLIVVDTLPAESHRPIRYHLAVLRDGRQPDAFALSAYFATPLVRELFADHGFTKP